MPENAAFEAVATPTAARRAVRPGLCGRGTCKRGRKRDADRAAAFADRAARDAACLRKEAKRRRRGTGTYFIDKMNAATITILATASLARATPVEFSNSNELKEAVGEWISDSGDAESKYGPIGDWDVSKVKNMASLCNSSASFDGDIGAWDVSKVTTLQGAFQGCASFNQDLSAWDVSKVTTLRGAFTDAAAFDQPFGALDFFGAFVAWDVSSVTTLQGAFLGCASFNQDLSAWDVSKVTTLRGAFSDAAAFDQNIGAWDVSSVTTLRRTFDGAAEFDAPIGAWDVSKVTTMVSTFEGAAAFDADIGDWDVSQVTVMDYMFLGADEFIQCVNWVTPANSFGVGGDPWHPDLQCYPFDNRNNLENAVDEWLDDSGDAQTKYGPISRWDTSRVTDMATLFQETASFDEPIGGWDTSKVTDMSFTFDAAAAFDQDIGAWDVSSVTDMYEAFAAPPSSTRTSAAGTRQVDGHGLHVRRDRGLRPGHQRLGRVVCDEYVRRVLALPPSTPIGGWEVSQVTNMVSTFQGAAAFDADIGNWDVSKVPDMSYLFSGAAAFDADIGNWDVSQVTSMYTMFWDAATFNQDIGEWDVSRVTDMYETFYNATAFNAAIGGWDVSQVSTMRGMFYDAVAFNALIGDWHVSKVTNMREMFFNAAAFDADIGDWDTSAVTNMYAAFADASAFNQPIGDWDVSPTTAKTDMFLNADAFDQCLPWYAEFTCNPTPRPPRSRRRPRPAPSAAPVAAALPGAPDAARSRQRQSAARRDGSADDGRAEDGRPDDLRPDDGRADTAAAPSDGRGLDAPDGPAPRQRAAGGAVSMPDRRAGGRADRAPAPTAAPAAAPVALRVVPEAVENADAVNPSAELVLRGRPGGADSVAASSQESYARYLRTVFRRPLDGDLLTTGRPLFRVFLGLATFWALAGLAARASTGGGGDAARPSEARRRSSAVLGRGASKHLETLEAHLSGTTRPATRRRPTSRASRRAAPRHRQGSYFRKTARQSFAARWPLLSLCRETLRRHHDWVSIYDAYDARGRGSRDTARAAARARGSDVAFAKASCSFFLFVGAAQCWFMTFYAREIGRKETRIWADGTILGYFLLFLLVIPAHLVFAHVLAPRLLDPHFRHIGDPFEESVDVPFRHALPTPVDLVDPRLLGAMLDGADAGGAADQRAANAFARSARARGRGPRRGRGEALAAAALGTALGLGGLAAFFLHEEVQAILFEAANLAAPLVILAALFVVSGRAANEAARRVKRGVARLVDGLDGAARRLWTALGRLVLDRVSTGGDAGFRT
ncbi:hypothetical protein JL722_15249 [Aureococcus anophagefferens]|nr:hypothetical protein JL722_15249 [Aureococcus anophagefferens]